MFIAALFRTAKTWKQPKYSLTDEWIKKWYMYTMEYLAIKVENIICEITPATHNTALRKEMN